MIPKYFPFVKELPEQVLAASTMLVWLMCPWIIKKQNESMKTGFFGAKSLCFIKNE